MWKYSRREQKFHLLIYLNESYSVINNKNKKLILKVNKFNTLLNFDLKVFLVIIFYLQEYFSVIKL